MRKQTEIHQSVCKDIEDTTAVGRVYKFYQSTSPKVFNLLGITQGCCIYSGDEDWQNHLDKLSNIKSHDFQKFHSVYFSKDPLHSATFKC